MVAKGYTSHDNAPLLLVVDMQIGFLNEHSRLIIPRVTRLLQECNQRRVPTIFTRFVNRPGSSFESLLNWTSVRERPETDLHGAFAGLGGRVIEKNYYTAFTDELDQIIAKKNCETVLIAGVSTESCVLKTALDAFERGLRPVVVSDACASDQGAKVHLHALELLTIMLGPRQIKTIDEVVREFKDRTSQRIIDPVDNSY